MAQISKEALAADQAVSEWSQGRGTLEEVAEALSRLPLVSTYGGSKHMAVSEIQEGEAPGFRVEVAEERDHWDGQPLVRVVREGK